MLQRAAETVSGDDECNDPAVLLACALGSTGCPAKCAEAEKETNEYNKYEGVQAGDLSVAVSTSSSVASIPNAGVIKVAELTIKASEEIQLQSLDVTRLGLSDNSNLKVWIEKDGKRITSASTFFGDSKANVTFSNGGYVVKGDETLDLVVSLNKAAAGDELQFKVSDVVSSAKNTTVSPDTTGLFRTANYTVTSVSTVAKSAGDTRNYDLAKETSFSFGEFQLINNSPASMEKDVAVKSITFKVTVTAWDIENISNWKLLRDSKEVSSKYTVNGKSLTFAVNDILESGKSATYKVVAEPTTIEQTTDSYTLSIDKDWDIVVEEIWSNDTAFRASVDGATKGAAFAKISLWITNIKGGNFTLTKDSNLASTVNAGQGYSDVTIAKGTIKVNQSAKFEDGIEIVETSALANLNTVLRRATLKIGNRTYQATEVWGTTNPKKIVFASEIYLEKGTQDVELQVSLQNNAPLNTKLTFNNIDGMSFLGGTAAGVDNGNYLNGEETLISSKSAMAGSIKVSTLNVQDQKFSFKKVGPSEDVKFVEGNTDEKVLFVGEINNNQEYTLDINSFKAGLVATATKVNSTDAAAAATSTLLVTTTDDDVELWKIYVAVEDGATSSLQPLTFGNVAWAKDLSIDMSSITIEPGKTAKFEVRFIPSANLRMGTAGNETSFKVAISAGGKLNGNTVNTSSSNSATVKVINKSSATIVADTAKNKIIFPGVSTEVAAFDLNVKNDSMEINTIAFDVTPGKYDSSKISDLTIDFGGTVGAPSFTWGNTRIDWTTAMNTRIFVKFDNTVTLPVANYKVKVYATFDEDALPADGGTEAPRAINSVAINPTSNTFTAATTDATATLNYSHLVAKAYPVLSRESFSRDVDAPALELGITKVEKDGLSAVVNVTKINWIYSTYTTAGGYVAQAKADLYAGGQIQKASSSLDMANIWTSKGLLKSSYHRVHVQDIDFEVTEDGLTTKYTGVSVDAIADFATLTNE